MNTNTRIELFVRRTCYEDICRSLQFAIWKMARAEEPDALWRLLMYIEMCFEDYALKWVSESLKKAMKSTLPVIKQVNLP